MDRGHNVNVDSTGDEQGWIGDNVNVDSTGAKHG